MEEKEIQTCVDGAVKTYFDKFAERVTQASEKNLNKTTKKFIGNSNSNLRISIFWDLKFWNSVKSILSKRNYSKILGASQEGAFTYGHF